MASETLENIIKILVKGQVDPSLKQSQILLKGIRKSFNEAGISAQKYFDAADVKMIKFKASLTSTGEQVGRLTTLIRLNQNQFQRTTSQFRINPKTGVGSVGATRAEIVASEDLTRKETKAIKENIEATTKLGEAKKKTTSEVAKMAKRAVEIVPIWMSIRTVYQSFIQLLQSSFRFLVEWETVMAKIAVVGGGTREELGKLSKDLLKLATAFGVSLNDLGEGARLWAQQGKTYAEVIPLMRTTAKLSIVTGRSMKDSVEDITSVMYSFGLEADNTTKIVDSLVAIDLKFAITTDVMAESLRKVGPVAKQMGLSLEKTLGIITATHLATRAKGGEIGNSLKTIFTRLATVSRDAIQTLAKVPVFLDEAGLATTENTGTFRDWGTILDEIADKYDTLDGSIQEDLAYQLAGVRQVTKLKAALAQWKEQLEATNAALNSEGASQRAVNILLDTSEAKARRLAGAWNELVDTVADTRGWKGLLDVLREAVLLTRDLAENAELAGPALALGEVVVPKGNVDAKPLLKRIMEQGVGGVFPELLKQRVEGAGDDKVTSELKKELAETEKLVEAKASGNLIDKETQEIELKRLDSLRDYGVEEAEIAKKKLAYLTQDKVYNDKDIINKRNQLKSEIEILEKKKNYTDFLLKEELVAKRLEGFGYNRIQIAIAELARKEAYLKAQNVDIENNKDIIKQRQEILQLVQEEINTYSKGLQDTLSGGLTDLLKGEKTLGQFGEGVASSVKDSVLGAFSEGIIGNVFQATGIGEAFGEELFAIKHVFDKKPKGMYDTFIKGGDYAADAMYESFVKGSKLLSTGGTAGTIGNILSGKSSSGTAGGVLGGALGVLGGLFGLGGSSIPKWNTRNYAAKSGTKAGQQSGNFLGGLGGIGNVANSALVGYSAFQSAGGSNGGGLAATAGILGGVGSLGVGIGMAGVGAAAEAAGGLAALGTTGALAALGPIGIAGIALVGASMLIPLFKKSVQVQEEIKTETGNVASKISVSNKELSVVNRNLIALKNEKTFILPESAYFSTASTIQDNFALHASRGLA